MKTDKLLVLIFLVLGVFVGFASASINDAISAGIFSILIYLVANILFIKYFKSKAKIVFGNSFATYFPIWFIIWIFLINLG